MQEKTKLKNYFKTGGANGMGIKIKLIL